jgi:hypothetical protein
MHRAVARRLTAGLCAAFLLTGAAALLFETLWFRLAGLALGNSIWASAAVLASFMAGLALGNGLAARFGERVTRPLRLYAVLEIGVAVTGLALVLGFPLIAERLAPLLAAWAGAEAVLHGARMLVAFGLMLLPATAMGTTLPLLARALVRHDARFGVALGRLYGWNTLGGVAGAVMGEGVLISQLGLSWAAVVAAGLNLAAAAVALGLDVGWGPSTSQQAPTPPSTPPGVRRLRRPRLLAAAFLGGAILLGLEIVWFRFLQLFVFGTQTVFALMLATVLAGIGLGGLLAAVCLRRWPGADHFVGLIALSGGIATIVTYAGFDPAVLPGGALGDRSLTLVLSAWLMLPTSLVSGVMFTLLGQALRREMRGDAEATGWLTLANTVGAALGAPVAGLLLLPGLGVERTLFALAVSYVLLAGLVLPGRDEPRATRYAVAGAVALFLLVAALFPFGLMYGRFVRLTLARSASDGARLVALREGLTETLLLLQKDWGGAPIYHRPITNAHSMTSTTFYGRRYMKLFAYWPLALRPESRRALLISYGLGNTGEALARSPSLTAIDVVDISHTILETPITEPHCHRRGGHLTDDPGDQPDDPVAGHDRSPRRSAGEGAHRGRSVLPADGLLGLRRDHRRAPPATGGRDHQPVLPRVLPPRAPTPGPRRHHHPLAAGEPAVSPGLPGYRPGLLCRVRGLQPVVGRRLRLDARGDQWRGDSSVGGGVRATLEEPGRRRRPSGPRDRGTRPAWGPVHR